MREKNSFSFWNILSLGDMELSGEDVGRTAEVRFTSFTGGGKWGINRTISFDVKIPKLFDTKYVELMDTLNNEDADMTVRGIDCSFFYTRLVGDLGDGTYMYRLANQDNHILKALGGACEENKDAEIYYEAFPKDCKAGKAWFVKNSNTQVKSEAVVFELSEQ